MSVGPIVRRARCPWGKLSVGRNVQGQNVHVARCRGASFHGASCPGASLDGASGLGTRYQTEPDIGTSDIGLR
jgi:hypothetical protein